MNIARLINDEEERYNIIYEFIDNIYLLKENITKF